MYIRRDFEHLFREIIKSDKILIVYGSRQTGKTTIVEHLLKDKSIQAHGVVMLNGDVKSDREMLAYETMTVEKARFIIGDSKTLFIDEAQKILDIGLTLKIIHDALKDVHIIATGSSSFELSKEVGEPLTGRMAGFVLPPLSFHELAGASSNAAEISRLETRLRLGGYPDVATADSEKSAIENLGQLCEAYLFKDVLKWRNLKNAEILGKLLKALALQLGNEVSYNEVGNLIGMDNETVGQYVERLEKAYILFRLPAFSRNIRNELKKSRKIYFNDTGIRNAVLGNYLPLDCREDVGHLFENYLITERAKSNDVKRIKVCRYFWRLTTPSDGEIDYVEELPNGELRAYEFKYGSQQVKKAKCPDRFAKAYPEASWTVISRDNYVGFVNGEL